MSCNCDNDPLLLPVGPQGIQGPPGSSGNTGRGIAVFVGNTSAPTNATCAANYATVVGFGVRGLSDALNLKPGDLWILP